MATSVITPGTVKKETGSVRYFDLDKFEKVSNKFEYVEPSDLTTVDQAKAEINGLEDKDILKMVNDYLKNKAYLDAKKANTPSSAASLKIVSQFVATFAQLPPFDSMPAKTKEEKAKRRAEILAGIKTSPFIVDSLRAKAMAAGVEDDEEENDEEEKDEA